MSPTNIKNKNTITTALPFCFEEHLVSRMKLFENETSMEKMMC
jgi:hypothetical protein